MLQNYMGTFILLFLSTLSLRRATKRRHKNTSFHKLFLSTLSLRRATFNSFSLNINGPLFLSTLSLRRATLGIPIVFSSLGYFYPRSPCGERPAAHFLYKFLINFYPRSPCGERPVFSREITFTGRISIHALLAESDPLRPSH